MIILLAEDDALIAMDMEMMLQAGGHEVLGPAANFEVALSLLRDVRPDVAVLDIGLKNGDSGIELARTLRYDWDIPVLFVSGEPTRARNASDVGVGVLTKPVSQSALLKSLDAVTAVARGEVVTAPPPQLELFESRIGRG